MNPRLKQLLDLWPQIVAGYHKSSDHYWQFVGEYNVVSEDIEFYLKHDGYCHSNLYFGPFKTFDDLQNWDGITPNEDGESLLKEMLDICCKEYILGLDPENDCDMPPEYWQKLIEKLKNL